MGKRIVVIANKHWEADPLVNVLVSDRVVPLELLGSIDIVNHPFFKKDGDGQKPQVLPRIEIELNAIKLKDRKVQGQLEVWCIQDLMNPANSSSSTREKAIVLRGALEYAGRQKPDLVIAFGTAAGLPEIPLNGCVVVGSSVFIHDPYADDHDPDKHWKPPRPDTVISSASLPGRPFKLIREDVRFPAEGRFLRPPLRTSDPCVIVAGDAFIALTNVNITNYDDYAWTDQQLLDKFAAVNKGRSRVGSLETTHGVIREAAGDETPFLFVSGIANAIGRFDYEVGPRIYGQDFVAAHNAGVTVAWLIPELLRFFRAADSSPSNH